MFPEFLYKPLYDSKHRALAMRNNQPGYRYEQKGLRERLLCEHCERRFGEFERQFSQIWYHPPKIPAKPHGTSIEISGLNYKSFKLFHLSIIWRAGVAERPEFNQTKLGPHQERIRDLLVRCDPGPPMQYAVTATVLIDPRSGELCDQIIMPPVPSRIGSLRIYLSAFGGCAWIYVVSSQPASGVPLGWLEATGSIHAAIKPFTEFAPFDRFMRENIALSRQS